MPLRSELQEIRSHAVHTIRSGLGWISPRWSANHGADGCFKTFIIFVSVPLFGVFFNFFDKLFFFFIPFFISFLACLLSSFLASFYFLSRFSSLLTSLFSCFVSIFLPFFLSFYICFFISNYLLLWIYSEHIAPLHIHCMCWNAQVQTCIYHGSCRALSRCFEVLPARAPWTINDLWTLQWLDPSLKVCIISDIAIFMLKTFLLLLLFSNQSFMSSCSIQDEDKRLQALFNACEKLPSANNTNFKWVSVSMFHSSPGYFFFSYMGQIIWLTSWNIPVRLILGFLTAYRGSRVYFLPYLVI